MLLGMLLGRAVKAAARRGVSNGAQVNEELQVPTAAPMSFVGLSMRLSTSLVTPRLPAGRLRQCMVLPLLLPARSLNKSSLYAASISLRKDGWPFAMLALRCIITGMS